MASPRVTTGQIMDAGNVFHADGLFSTQIFGEVGTKERLSRNGHIDLRIKILHPLAWIGITSMSALHKRILASDVKVKWNNKLKDFEENEDGETGFNLFMGKLKDIKFENPNNSDLRHFKIRLTSETNTPEMLATDKM